MEPRWVESRSPGEQGGDVHKHYNGLKTAALFSVLWAVLLGLGALIGAGTRSSAPNWIMALVGVATTAYGY
jgi:heat shock protein HtpX